MKTEYAPNSWHSDPWLMSPLGDGANNRRTYADANPGNPSGIHCLGSPSFDCVE